MGIYKRQDSPFWWIWLEGAGRAEKTRIPVEGGTPELTKRNKDLAQAAYAVRMAALARGAYDLPDPDAPLVTFRQMAKWYEQHEIPKHQGAEREREILPRLVDFFGALELKAVTQRKAHEYETRRLGERASARTVNRETDLLKSILQAAVPDYLPASPLYGMRRLRVTKPKRRLMTPQEEDRLLAQLGPVDKAIVMMGLDTLCRLGDILDLRRADDHGTYLYIADPKDPQQSEPYTVPVSRRLRKALDAVPADGPYYFRERRIAKTERDRRNTIRQVLERACQAAGIPYGRKQGGITFHWATRRTAATRLIRKGVDLKTVQALGHWKRADVVLDIYSEALDADVRRAVEQIGPPTRHSKRTRHARKPARIR